MTHLRVGLATLVAVAGCGGDDNNQNRIDASVGEDGGDDGPDAGVSELPSTRFKLVSENRDMAQSGLVSGFYQAQESISNNHWTLIDIDADGLRDLIQTGDTAQLTRVWDAGGSPYWKVFLNTGDGWSRSATEWPVPTSGTVNGFYTASINGTTDDWTTIDMDGDQRVDLVQTTDPATSDVWDETTTPYWKVFRNTGEGFDTVAIEWSVPTTTILGGFSTTNDSTNRWATRDIDGDRTPDLIQPRDPATGNVWDETGTPHWIVFLGGEDGFASSPTMWSVPNAGIAGGFDQLDLTGGGTTASINWATLDIDADRLPDLIQTSDPVTGSVWDETGSPHWKVFRNTGDGFALAASPWSVPSAGIDDGFFVVSQLSGGRHWSVFDMDGDREPDLVQTGDVSHIDRVWDATGTPYWKVFFNNGTGFFGDVYRWPIPGSGEAQGFFAARVSATSRRWVTVDVSGDGRPDLVHTTDSSTNRVWDAAGSPYWKVYVSAP